EIRQRQGTIGYWDDGPVEATHPDATSLMRMPAAAVRGRGSKSQFRAAHSVVQRPIVAGSAPPSRQPRRNDPISATSAAHSGPSWFSRTLRSSAARAGLLPLV